MEWNDCSLFSTTVIENAKYETSQENKNSFEIDLHSSIQQPRKNTYFVITDRDIDKIQKSCKSLKKRSIILSDVWLSVGSLFLGAFFSAFLGGVSFSNLALNILIYSLSFGIGCAAFVVSIFLKKQENVDSKKVASDIEEIIDYTLQLDEEAKL